MRGRGQRMFRSDSTLGRRELLRFLSMGVGCCALSGLAPVGALAAHVSGSYYVDPKNKFLPQFAGVCQGVRQMLVPKVGPEKAASAAREALSGFTAQLPILPGVGGARNPDTQYIVIAAWYAALGQALFPIGLTAEDVGRMVYDLNAGELKQANPGASLATGTRRFTPQSYAQGVRWAKWTQKREYPGNWVAEFLIGSGGDFDFGYDYSECGVVKHLKAQGFPQLAPYVCLNDFLSSRAQGTGLIRSETLALGYDRCDFRYKKEREVTQDWETEAPKIRARAGELGWT